MLTLSRIAGLGAAAKIGIGVSVAAATVAATGAAGMLPAGASHGVRHAIEAVTPVTFHDEQDHPDNFGSRVSSDAKGDSDGQNGVDGHTISSEAPGAAHRSTSNAKPDEPPGQSGVTGLDRANQTPAADHAPDSVPQAHAGTVPSTVPDHGQGQGHGGQPTPVPSTVPDHPAPQSGGSSQ
jgi:hypothetical protein